MKILYAIQATGNGHISRAIELLPYLKQKAEVHVFLSGAHSVIDTPFDVNYRSKGFSFFYKKSGAISLSKTIKAFNPVRLYKEINNFPVEEYDLIINDFEFITSRSAKQKGVPIVALSHQASFLSASTPRPSTSSFLGESILRSYAPASKFLGFHFKSYDAFITTPVIRKSIRSIQSFEKKHITVYLPSYGIELLKSVFQRCSGSYHFFIPGLKSAFEAKNCTFFPAHAEAFVQSMAHSNGIICGAGFEAPSEALYLGKPLLVIPVKGQYEQLCNAEALKQLGVNVISNSDLNQIDVINAWINNKPVVHVNFPDHSEYVIERTLELANQCNYSFASQNIQVI